MNVVLSCSNCRKPLCDLSVRPGDGSKRFRAECPYCGDHSFAEELAGRVSPAGYWSEEGDRAETLLAGFSEADGLVTVRVTPNWRA